LLPDFESANAKSVFNKSTMNKFGNHPETKETQNTSTHYINLKRSFDNKNPRHKHNDTLKLEGSFEQPRDSKNIHDSSVESGNDGDSLKKMGFNTNQHPFWDKHGSEDVLDRHTEK